jgi:alpha-beta hydrolase superfamily lysophospholipase
VNGGHGCRVSPAVAAHGILLPLSRMMHRSATPTRGTVISRAATARLGLGATAVVTTILALVQASCALARPAQARIGGPPADLGGQSVTFPSASGATVHAWFSPGRPGAGAVLVLHGVGANRLLMRARARFLHRAGYAVLVPDLQAHGETRGTHITFGALESYDAAAALAYLRARAPGERVGVIGISMGGAATLVGAGPLRADALVLESVYPTIDDAVRDRLRAWLGPLRTLADAGSELLLRRVGAEIGVQPRELRPIDRISHVTAPILLIAGTADRYTPLGESRALFARACAPKTFWAVRGAGHEDLHAYAPAEYERRVGGFLAARLRHASGVTRRATSTPPAACGAAALGIARR